jgi:hypothetical protein
LRIDEGGPECDVARGVVEVGFDSRDLAVLIEDVIIRHTQLDFHSFLGLRVLAIGEILGFGHIEIHPHAAVVRQFGEQFSFIEQTAFPHMEATHDAVEWRTDLRESQMRLRHAELRLGLVVLCLGHRQFIGRNHVAIRQRLGVPVFDHGELRLGFCALHFGLIV